MFRGSLRDGSSFNGTRRNRLNRDRGAGERRVADPEKRHRVNLDPQAAVYVDGDSARLVQCVTNLLANAIKYTDRAARSTWAPGCGR